MGPRLGRVEYSRWQARSISRSDCFNGATLRTRGIQADRLLRACSIAGFNGATLRTRGIRENVAQHITNKLRLQWGHA